ncbi:hypothetical protein ACCS44_37410, partial [Rhizobium ruizarguesonis]
SSVKRLRFILWSSQMGQSLLQNGLFQRGKVKIQSTSSQPPNGCSLLDLPKTVLRLSINSGADLAQHFNGLLSDHDGCRDPTGPIFEVAENSIYFSE